VPRVRHDTKVEALRRAPLFAGLAKSHLTELARQSEEMEVAAGTVLCREGQTGQEFFVLLDGEAEVTSGQGGPVRKVGPGDFFGEIALLEPVKRTATVTATTPLHFFVLTRQSFQRMLDENPQVERRVLRELAHRVITSHA
jgi:CRP/FNR family transcriptional regulator, cyclic AMP receptor protein